MSPSEFLSSLAKRPPAPAYLFLGPEGYERERCRKALIDRVLGGENHEAGYTRHDLDEISLAAALDDARSLSLFAPRRVIWLASAESALPRGRAIQSDEESSSDDASALSAYLTDPSPDTVIVLDAARYDFDGEDRAKIERVQKFFGAVTARVEFRPFSSEAARDLARTLARERGLQLGPAELSLLVEATGGEAQRIAQEIEKLSLWAGTTKAVTADDLTALVADARASTIFALVNAIGRNDRARSLEILHTLVREGEYMPLALAFLATQFRMALAASEADLHGSNAILGYFNRIGARIWPDRARQIEQTASSFSKAELQRAISKVFETDRALRDARPDDRIVMEEMILELTSG